MKVLIVYDSVYGNTEKIAQAIGRGIEGDVKIIRASEAKPADINSIDVLIVGSPTQAFRPIKPVKTFLNNIPSESLKGIKVIVFDTRMPVDEVGSGLRFIMKMGGYAAPRIAKALEKKGGSLLLPPEGFLVTGQEGPLKDGELERATEFTSKVINPG